MATWRLKIRKIYADEIMNANKLFEIREEDDKLFQRGDYIEFEVVEPNELPYALGNGDYSAIKESHAIENLLFEITTVIHGFGLKEGWCAFGIKPLIEDKDPVIVRPADNLKKELIMEALRNIKKSVKSKVLTALVVFSAIHIKAVSFVPKGHSRRAGR